MPAGSVIVDRRSAQWSVWWRRVGWGADFWATCWFPNEASATRVAGELIDGAGPTGSAPVEVVRISRRDDAASPWTVIQERRAT